MTRTRTAVGAASLLLAAACLPVLVPTQAQAAGPVYLQWDFNSDGNADLAVGAPGEDLTGARDAGSVSVFMAGATGAYTSSTQWTQANPALRGKAEAGDQFGYALTSGDYNGDNYADLAIAANQEDYGSGSAIKVDTGNVTVLWGSSTGLTTSNVAVLWPSVNGVISAYSYMGDSLASGDMNNDQQDELAVGLPGVETAKVYTGSVQASFGTVSTDLSQDALPGTKTAGDLFGETLAMGNFDGDPYMDLAVGAPYDSQDTHYSVGSVLVIPGSADLIDSARAHYWAPSNTYIAANPHTFTVNDMPDSYGRTLAAGDFNGDSYDDLAIGIPGSPVASVQDAGTLNILYGQATDGISVAATLKNDLIYENVELYQTVPAVPSTSTTGGLFSASLAAGKRAGKSDLLAIGSGKENVYSFSGTLSTGTWGIYTQTLTDGIWGDRTTGNGFGSFVRFLDNEGTGNASLAVSAPGVEGASGAVFVLPSTGTVPTGTGSVKWDESTDPTPGGKEAGDSWGWLGDSH